MRSAKPDPSLNATEALRESRLRIQTFCSFFLDQIDPRRKKRAGVRGDAQTAAVTTWHS